MDVKLLASTFMTVFLAELGDKTQLATFALASGAHSRATVFIGAALALCLTSAIGVVAGAAIGNVPALWIRRAAGTLFIVLGLVYLLSE